ncbi:unnamed protein product [Polarella glacialis]|uniref:Elongation factor Ts, mitochondrial n=1 Tax=Polarella glacialis TaxID=89957 RepID=A0A813G504_POLGL|nr:unnamed protein product [Polarella glacialis]
MVADISDRRVTRCALLSAGGLMAYMSRGAQQAFLNSAAPGSFAPLPVSPLQGSEQVFGGLAAPTLLDARRSERSDGSWAFAPALLALGAAAAFALKSRDESRTTMFSKHDRRTFRGKLHGHTFGKYRLRKNKLRRIQGVRNGTIDLENIPQQGQPEPEHCWDIQNLLSNPMYYYPPLVRAAFQDIQEERFVIERANWKELMGKKGNQWAFKGWTPPGMTEKVEAGGPVPPKEVAASVVGEKISAKDVKTLRERSRAGILDCQKALAENGGEMEKAMEWLKKKGIAKADKKAGNVAVEGNIASYVHFNNKIAVLVEVNSETDFVASNAIFKDFANDVAMQIAANSTVTYVTSAEIDQVAYAKEKELEMAKEDLAGKPDAMKEKIVEGRLKKKFEENVLMGQKWIKNEDITVEQALKETIAKIGENIVIRRFMRINLGEGLAKKDNDFAAGVEKELAKYKDGPGDSKPAEKPAEAPKPEAPKAEAPKPEVPAVPVTAQMVKELRARSGAGPADCKKALVESGADGDKAMEWLKKKGISKAEKKIGNLSVEGAVASYVHFNSKLGVIVEVNSETDFVAMNAIFKEFAADVAMQVAALPQVSCVSADEVSPALYAKTKELEMAKEDLAGKPEDIKEKIVIGRLKKQFDDVCLLNQKWIKDENLTVSEVLKQKIAKLGENIVIRRFARLTLGEGLEKKDADFAAGVEKELAKFRA